MILYLYVYICIFIYSNTYNNKYLYHSHYTFNNYFIIGNLKTGNVLYNYTAAIGDAEPEPGLPDGLKVDIYGNIFASGMHMCMYMRL